MFILTTVVNNLEPVTKPLGLGAASYPTRAFYGQVAVPMRWPDAGRRLGCNLPHVGLANLRASLAWRIMPGSNSLTTWFVKISYPLGRGWLCQRADFPIFNIAAGDYIHSTAIR